MLYRVVPFDQKTQPGEPVKIEADSPQEAAEAVCGPGLMEAGVPGNLRAQVAPVEQPGQKRMFYAPPELPYVHRI